MIRWTFETFVSASQRNDVQTTIDAYDDHAREAFSRAVKHLSITPIQQWQEPHFKKLKGQDHIYEIRYKADQRSTRAFGFFEESRRVFVIVLIGFHKGRVYHPHDAFEIAQRRATQIKSGLAGTAALQALGETFPENEG